jgi:hypothetical protein
VSVPSQLRMPPPKAALFPVTWLSISCTVPLLWMPPPWSPWFSVMVQPVNVNVAVRPKLRMPPPPLPTLPLTVQLVSVSVP